MIEKYLQKNYPSGSIGAFMTSYFEIAFKGKDEATDFEKATTTQSARPESTERVLKKADAATFLRVRCRET